MSKSSIVIVEQQRSIKFAHAQLLYSIPPQFIAGENLDYRPKLYLALQYQRRHAQIQRGYLLDIERLESSQIVALHHTV